MDPDRIISGVGRDNPIAQPKRRLSRPPYKPGDDSDFKRIVRQKDNDSKQKGRSTVSSDDKERKSVFDLAGGKPVAERDAKGVSDERVEDSDSHATPDPGGMTRNFPNKASGQVPDKASGQMPELEQNLAMAQNVVSSSSSVAETAIRSGEVVGGLQIDRAEMKALVDQIVDKLYTVKAGGTQDTAMLIKHPPLLAGSELVVKSFDSARGEFNIAFHNLTQESQALLQAQQVHLMRALEERGYVAHIVVTTTEAYEPETLKMHDLAGGQLGRQQREEQQEQNSGRPRDDQQPG